MVWTFLQFLLQYFYNIMVTIISYFDNGVKSKKQQYSRVRIRKHEQKYFEKANKKIKTGNTSLKALIYKHRRLQDSLYCASIITTYIISFNISN